MVEGAESSAEDLGKRIVEAEEKRSSLVGAELEAFGVELW